MGWKLTAGLLVAAALALGIFRKQFAGVFSSAGGAIGESIGGLVGSIPAGIQAGGAKAAGDWWAGIGDFLAGGGAVGQYFKEQETSRRKIEHETDIIGGTQDTATDRIITSYNRDYSDARTQTARVQEIVKTLPVTIPYAVRARSAIYQTGFSPLKSFKASLPALRAQGLNVSEAYKVWSGKR